MIPVDDATAADRQDPARASNQNATDSATPEPHDFPASTTLHWLVTGVSAALLILLLVSGMLALRWLRQMYARQQAVTQELAARTQMISALWLSVQNYDQAVQDFVNQTKVSQNKPTRQYLDQLTLEIDQHLKSYPADRDATEAALLVGMQDVFSEQHTLYISWLASPPGERRHEPENLDSARMVSLQKRILDWSSKFQTWNGRRFALADQSLVANFGNLQRRLSLALAIGFGSGLLLVSVSMAYIVRLERQTRHRYVELARSQQDLQQLSSRLLDAQETERRSIARELHDEIGQSLGAVLVDIGRLSTMLSHESPDVRAELENVKSVAQQTFQSVRNIALLLRPSMLDDLGLIPALEWQGREVSRRTDIEVAVESDGMPEDLPDEYRICIYRLTQEALNNIVRHSGAKNASVSLGSDSKKIVVRISDDGRGFNPSRTRGLGILGMEERVKRLSGTFKLDSKPGTGTTLTVELPLPAGNTAQS
jgi:signal transduction histidine kinase